MPEKQRPGAESEHTDATGAGTPEQVDLLRERRRQDAAERSHTSNCSQPHAYGTPCND
jgi:hypothetical protein